MLSLEKGNEKGKLQHHCIYRKKEDLAQMNRFEGSTDRIQANPKPNAPKQNLQKRQLPLQNHQGIRKRSSNTGFQTTKQSRNPPWKRTSSISQAPFPRTKILCESHPWNWKQEHQNRTVRPPPNIRKTKKTNSKTRIT